MRRRLLVILLLLLPHAFSGVTSATVLSVVELSPAPNYASSTDPADAQQLTDGATTAYPIWMKKEAVGWAALTPVTIQLRLGDGSSMESPRAGTLRLHSAKGLSSGVDLPRQIDVYTRDPNNNLRLVGSTTPVSGDFNDKSAHWLTLDVRGATGTLLLILHAAGDYLFLDEVEWLPAGKGSLPVNAPIANSVRNAQEDSTRRISDALRQAGEAETARVALPLASRAMHAWLEDPWAEIDPARAGEQIRDQPPRIDIQGYAGEHESVCLGIAVGEEAATSGLRVTVSGLPSESVKLFQLTSVTAANGKRVYDPLVPLKGDAPSGVKAGVPLYIWVDVNLAMLGPGTYRFEIRLESSNRVLTIPAVATIATYSGAGTKPLHAVNWAYLSDMPIFRNQEAAVRDLVLHGINTFVAAPAEIPGVALDGSWIGSQATRFTRTAELAKQQGMLLLYLGWSADKNPLGFSPNAHAIDPAARKRLSVWITQLSTYLAGQGIPLDRWALYPVDEPNRDGLSLIKAVAEVVKQVNPAIQIYADPSVHANPPLTLSDLRSLEAVVDYWQPNLLAVRGPLGSFFTGLQREWWLYGNPKSPAKLGSPLRDYRLLAWWAWHYRARGVGFWSYSDTNSSSAWNDLDSRRPDWAVVYESDTGVVSSRRWEAFREGLEDYILLSAINRSETLRAFPVGDTDNFDRWNSAAINGVRRTILNALLKAQ